MGESNNRPFKPDISQNKIDMITVRDIIITNTDQAVVFLKDIQNKIFYLIGDQNNSDNIYIGDKSVKRYVSGTTPQTGLPIVPFKGAVANYNQVQKIYVDDSNFLYLIGKAGDILHVVITESEIFDAIKYLITNLPRPDNSDIIQKLQTLIDNQKVVAK